MLRTDGRAVWLYRLTVFCCVLAALWPVGQSLLGMQVGDIIRLDQDCDHPLVIRVEGVPKFTGFARVVKQKKAVEIVTRLQSQTEEEPNE